MLRVINTQKLSILGHLKNLMQDSPRTATTSSAYDVYRDETLVAELTVFIAGNSQFNLGGKIFTVWKAKGGVFTQEWRLEGNGKSVANAKMTQLNWIAKCRINHRNLGPEFELTLRTNPWRIRRGNELRVFEADNLIGNVERQGWDVTIDVPSEISIPVQLFIVRLAETHWDSGTH